MARPSLPAVFRHLVRERNPAADAAIVEALPTLEPFAQAAALRILLQRSDAAAQADVVGRFLEHDAGLQRLIVSHVNELSSGVRLAISSSSFRRRAGAIETVVRGAAGRLGYLLADALRSRCPRTRELAAAGLHRMTAELLDHLEAGPAAGRLLELSDRADCLAEALKVGVHRWEIHLQPKVLEAALWLGDRTAPAVLEKLRSGRTKIGRPLTDLLAGTLDPRLAGFMLRALAVAELRSTASRAISRAGDETFLRALFAESWLLADPRIEQGCRWIRDIRWSQDAVGIVLALDERFVANAVRLLAAIGGSRERRTELLRELIGSGRSEPRGAVVRCLVNDESETSTGLLATVAGRSGDGVAALAARELRRRRGGPQTDAGSTAAGMDAPVAAASREVFERYWGTFDDLESEARAEAGDTVRREVPNLDAVLRAKLASTEALDRARALRIVSSLGLVKALAERLYLAASDADPMVRSRAVGMLVELPGATTERLLRNAANDPDERVQADAIEALDRLDAADRIRYTEPKLESTDSRVRANAVRSLLRAESPRAGDELLDMLEDSSAAHRRGALWVIEQLHLKSARRRVEEVSRADPDPRVRERAAKVLAAIASEPRPYGPPTETAVPEIGLRASL
jgi:HEAT repeat protein